MAKIKVRVKPGQRHGMRVNGKLVVYQEGDVFKADESILSKHPDKVERAGNRARVAASTPGSAGGTAREAASGADSGGDGDGGATEGQGEAPGGAEAAGDGDSQQ